tara:strand:+ start:1083 stop:1277 length:195 start_codon:yes stop_codon:yes gene_type:complete
MTEPLKLESEKAQEYWERIKKIKDKQLKLIKDMDEYYSCDREILRSSVNAYSTAMGIFEDIFRK